MLVLIEWNTMPIQQYTKMLATHRKVRAYQSHYWGISDEEVAIIVSFEYRIRISEISVKRTFK